MLFRLVFVDFWLFWLVVREGVLFVLIILRWVEYLDCLFNVYLLGSILRIFENVEKGRKSWKVWGVFGGFMLKCFDFF